MKNARKLISALLAVAAVFSLCACSQTDEEVIEAAKIAGNAIVQKLMLASLHVSTGYSMSASAVCSPVGVPQYAQISAVTGAPQEEQYLF